MRKAICTITSTSHLFKVMGLRYSLKDHPDIDFHCLITDDQDSPFSSEGIRFHRVGDLRSSAHDRIKSRHKGDHLRWACKPLLMIHLLEDGYDKVIYVDNDMFFFGSPEPVFHELDRTSLLLTPHYYPSNPQGQQYWLEANFRVGLYNAGLIAVAKGAEAALNWWAECCAYNVKKSAWRGLFDDQKYLDLVPILFPDSAKLQHRGCNVAGWNAQTVTRELDGAGNILLGGRWPLVCVHFNVFTFRAILRDQDPLLRPLLDCYEEVLRQWRPQYTVKEETRLGLSDAQSYLRHLLWLVVRRMEAARII